MHHVQSNEDSEGLCLITFTTFDLLMIILFYSVNLIKHRKLNRFKRFLTLTGAVWVCGGSGAVGE